MPTKQYKKQSFLMVLLVPTTIALAQSNDGSLGDSPWIGVVTAETADIRCGSNESYYAIATAKKGDLVRVHGKRQDWLKVDTSGSVFEDTVGYIKYPAVETDVFEVTGESGCVSGDLDVLAKNTESVDLYRSWRPILQLQSGDQVQVVESTTTSPGTLHRDAYVVHTIKLPTNAIGWVDSSTIERATPELISMLSDGAGFEIIPTESVSLETAETVVVETKPVRLEPLTLVGLEEAWKKITAEPAMGAEVEPLRVMYLELLSENSGDLVIEQIAGGRIKQLGVWSGLQKQREKIESLRLNLAEKSGDVTDYQSVVSLYGDYVLVGRLSMSNTFNGQLRPFMYRIQDVDSGRTLGYLPVNKDWDLTGLVGETIGLVGNDSWNANWRVRVVDAKRFDILSPTTATVTPDIQ
ncbi:MAG: hypothetical protein H8E83_04740 [Planctomycetes bacterium]|nr:hypothetical protein [Planctomycetota bacterium]